ncbi:MAG: hypothetical protein AAF228_12205 [Pseudomonadota bacterium]
MHKIRPGFIIPSAAYTINPKCIKNYEKLDRVPLVGDVVLGKISHMGEHGSLENREGRIHMITDRTRSIFVFGNRYAPDYFEGHIPDKMQSEVDLLSRSGVIGMMHEKNTAIKDPTKVEILGYVVDDEGEPINTRDFPLANPKAPLNKEKKRAPMILNIGTSMNSGKSTSAIACCWALSAMGYDVRASKVTGTASLKDILHMQDAGAEHISDFSYLGFPSTYMLDEEQVMEIFENLDGKYGANSNRFWVVEFADGIMQRETAMLLRNQYVRSRIHRLVFSAVDAFGAIGGLRILEEEFGLIPDAISGRCTSSPLMIKELKNRTDIPVYNNIKRDLNELSEILL